MTFLTDSDPRPSIWVVDDSPLQGAFTERALGPDFRCERFTDGTSVIERLAAAHHQPDILILDWVMPGMTGDEVCRYLRKSAEWRELPIVIVTASRTETEDIVVALESGANDYVAKPFIAEELRARVAAILRVDQLKRSAERERRRVNAMNELASALFRAGNDVDKLLGEIASWFVASISDGCAIELTRIDATPHQVVRQRSTDGTSVTNTPPLGIMTMTRAFDVRELARGSIMLSRDARSRPFDQSDETTIESSLEYVCLALEAALRWQNERATMRFHEEMLGIVGHDLRTPLSAFQMGLECLADGASREHADVLARLDRSANRMTKIIDQLLDVTRARIGNGIPVSPRPTGLRAVVDDVLEELRTVHRATEFEVEGAEVEGHWDRDRLEQVVANLATNATLYGLRGRPIRIAVSTVDLHAHLVVHNEIRGAPIPPELLESIFDPFKRGRANDTTGLGLGLYIVHEIVRAHGGTIAVRSDAEGTRFHVRLPLAGPERGQ